MIPFSAPADPIICTNTSLRVTADQPADAALACETAARAQTLFAQCGLPPFPTPLRIDIVSDLDQGCMGLFHCGEALIEVLTPPLMETRRSPQGAFALVPTEAYFQNVIVHELTHAALDDVACPFAACIVGDEYLAYVMQVMSLEPDQRAAFAARLDPDERISRDALNSAILMMAPHIFAQKAWGHFMQRDDPCGFARQIADRTVLLDRERFDF